MEALLLKQMREHDDPYRFWNQPSDGLAEPVLNEKIAKPAKKKEEEKFSNIRTEIPKLSI